MHKVFFNSLRLLYFCFLMVLVSACHVPPSEVASDEVDANSMQAIAQAQQKRLAMPGRAHYETACASCHEGAVARAPHRQMIELMTPASILASLNEGVMQAQSAGLTGDQRREVAEYLAGSALTDAQTDSTTAIPSCSKGVGFDPDTPAVTHNWGLSPGNGHFVAADEARLPKTALDNLQPSWAIAFPGANRVRSQPLLAGGLLFVGSHSGEVYALDQVSGCAVWRYQASAEVRTGIVMGTPAAAANASLYFGDVLGNVYAVDAATGQLNWRDRADPHPNATITGTPSLHQGRLYVPVSALEVSNAIDPQYPCCTFRGSVVAYAAESGKRQWQSFTIPNPPAPQGKNAAGTTQWGPSGAVIWNSPAIDPRRQQLYVGTGENASSPATDMSDSIIAMDLTTGKINWVFQATANDAWNTACDTATPDNCPEEKGPDFDFGAAIVLAGQDPKSQRVVGGQKSGLVHGLNPDTGELVWQQRVGRGGIQGGVHFGLAADAERLYIPVTDMADGRTYPDLAQPGIHALDIQTGEPLWYTPASNNCGDRAFCHPGYSQAITIAGDVIVAGGMDGLLRLLDKSDGRELFRLDTLQEFDTVAGNKTQGGSFGGGAAPVVKDGKLVISSGYGIYNHMPGNLLLMLTLP